MKKIYVLFLITIMATSNNAWAQEISVLGDPTRVYDTISDFDSCYFYSHPKPCIVPSKNPDFPSFMLMQEYVATTNITVYGVAITFAKDRYSNPIFDNNIDYQAVLTTYLGPSPYSGHISMQPVDTVTLNRSHPRFCWFAYKNYDTICKESSVTPTFPCNDTTYCNGIVPCYELYFDTPAQINTVTNTFYVGMLWSTSIVTPRFYGGRYDNSLPGHLYTSPGPNFSMGGIEFGYDYFSCLNGGFSYKQWGIAFPIIGFRCGPMKNYWLEEYGGNYAIVRWRSTEPGTLFNLRLVGEDGSDTTIVTQDTVYVFNWLSDSYRYNVTLRKQCHYCTSNYDTTVYGAWTPPVHFGTTWRTVTADVNDPDMGTVSGGGVYPDSSTVTLTANGFNDNEFYKWNDSVTANPRQILVVSDTSFSAIFHKVVDTVTGDDTIVGGDTVGIVLPAAEGFSLQPNPAHGTVHILLPTTATGGRLSLCDVTGREVQACTVTSTAVEWDLSRLPVGTYLVKLSTPQGTATQKLVIQE